ncbi:nuclear pore complex protein Nup155-like [Limulus polyphemus]|uniref:Nuclear pore complex protein Nup155-like n=1 Tax=Limulus polyphemus TaxID=6850 RepID=A0ABM1C3A9_LIMPO|nr:nuclear pore complex protein Nup155-like [Limulus polyphemus]
MCLILACSRMTQEEQVAEWATRAFLLYGGEPCISFPVPTNPSSLMIPPSSPAPTFGPSTVPAWSSTPAVGHHPGTTFSVPGSGIPYSPVVSLNQTYGLPSQEQQSMLTQQQLPSGGPEMVYSGKHNGLYLYLSRILR